jgi:hypothetical protein
VVEKKNLFSSCKTSREYMLELMQLEEKYIDLFYNKYNMNPAAESRLGAKHSADTKALFSKLNKEEKKKKKYIFSYFF